MLGLLTTSLRAFGIKQGCSVMNNIERFSAHLTWAIAIVCGGLLGCDRDPILGMDAFAPVDTTRPRVILTVPADGAAGVATNTIITATFSEDMAPATINGTTFTVTGPGATVVNGAVTYVASSRTATFAPDATLAINTLFTATITTGATDLVGNQLGGNQAPLPAASNYVWTFTTGATTDATAPTVTLRNPANLATGVCLQQKVNATFSEPMDPATISTASFTLQVTGPPLGAVLGGTVSYDAPSQVATLDPTSDLLANTEYTATVTTGARDLAGNPLAADDVWTFTTGATACAPPTNPNILGTAEPFGVFGGSAGMTNTGIQTVISGDIGTIATGTSSVTGFHDALDVYTETPANIGAVNGKIYTCTSSTTGPTSTGPNAVSCNIATEARLDAEAAYLALQALPPGANPGQNLGSLTLAPGVYTAPGGDFLIEGGDLTLDAQGDPDAVWVFQMATSLTVGGPGAAFPQSIILAGGAQPGNIFWAVGSFATINAAGGGTMVGTIIAEDGIAFSTAGNTTIVTLEGRALSLGASVTLVDTVINVPAP